MAGGAKKTSSSGRFDCFEVKWGEGENSNLTQRLAILDWRVRQLEEQIQEQELFLMHRRQNGQD